MHGHRTDHLFLNTWPGALQTWTWMEKETCRRVVQLTEVWQGLIHTLVCLLCAKERKCSASHVQVALFTYFGLFADRCDRCRCPAFYCSFAKLNRIRLVEFRWDGLESSAEFFVFSLSQTSVCSRAWERKGGSFTVATAVVNNWTLALCLK